MKTFSTIWSIFIIALILFACIKQSINYYKTKDEESISPEDLKNLKKYNLRFTLIIGAFIILDYVNRLLD